MPRRGCAGCRLFFAMGLGAEVATEVVDTAEMDLPKRVSINRGQCECVCRVLPHCGKAQRAGILLSALLPKALLLNATQQRGVSWPPPTQHRCGRAIRCHGRSCGSCGRRVRRRNQMPCSSPLQRSAHTRSARSTREQGARSRQPSEGCGLCARGAPKVINETTPRLRHSSTCVGMPLVRALVGRTPSRAASRVVLALERLEVLPAQDARQQGLIAQRRQRGAA